MCMLPCCCTLYGLWLMLSLHIHKRGSRPTQARPLLPSWWSSCAVGCDWLNGVGSVAGLVWCTAVALGGPVIHSWPALSHAPPMPHAMIPQPQPTVQHQQDLSCGLVELKDEAGLRAAERAMQQGGHAGLEFAPAEEDGSSSDSDGSDSDSGKGDEVGSDSDGSTDDVVGGPQVAGASARGHGGAADEDEDEEMGEGGLAAGAGPERGRGPAPAVLRGGRRHGAPQRSGAGSGAPSGAAATRGAAAVPRRKVTAKRNSKITEL